MAELIVEAGRIVSEDQLGYIRTSLGNSFKIDDLQVDGTKLVLQHRESDAGALTKALKQSLFISRSINKDVVYEASHDCRYSGDPQVHLEATKSVVPVQPGFFTLQGEFLAVFRAVNDAVFAIANRVGAIEQEYPAVWPVRLFKKINYFSEFPQQVIMCAPVKPDYDSRKEFAKRYSKDADFTRVATDELMDDAEYGLEAAVCDCCYYGLEGVNDQQNHFYTCYNKVFRNERSATKQLDRLTNFSVRDIMFVGTEDFVLECRQKLIDELSEFLRQLQLRAKIETANDPFFANDSAMKSVFQNSQRLKYELLAYIPHSGAEIAVGSVNLHLDFFGNAFDIKTPNGSTAHSGCIGVGMERMAYALFCQHGHSTDDWPSEVVDFLRINKTKVEAWQQPKKQTNLPV